MSDVTICACEHTGIVDIIIYATYVFKFVSALYKLSYWDSLNTLAKSFLHKLQPMHEVSLMNEISRSEERKLPNLFCDSHLQLSKLGERRNHQQILHATVKHSVEWLGVQMGHGADSVGNFEPNLAILFNLASLQLLRTFFCMWKIFSEMETDSKMINSAASNCPPHPTPSIPQQRRHNPRWW